MSILNGSVLTLYGTVGAGVFEDADSFTAKDVRDALTDHGPGDLIVNLNSGGGVALEGLAIFNILKAHPGRVTINVDAIAASAASLIAMAGNDIVMRDGALIMIHDPRAITAGTADEHRKSASRLETLSEQFRGVYAARTGNTEKEITDLMAAETWMDADSAILSGFATRKANTVASRMIAFDYSLYLNPPATLLEKGTVFMSTIDIESKKEKPWARRFYASAGNAGLSIAELNDIVDTADTAEIAKDALIAKIGDTNNAGLPSRVGGRQPSVGSETMDNPDFLGKAIEGALYARMSGTTPDGASRELMGRSLLDLGAATLELRGEKVSWSNRDGIAARIMMSGSHSTSDFPNLLLSSGNRVLMDAYTVAACPLKGLAKRRDAPDFRPLTSIRLSEAPNLDLKVEGAEMGYGSRSESAGSFGLSTYGKIFSLTREAIVNDDLEGFSKASQAGGRAAARKEADCLVALFNANTGSGLNLADGAPIYGTARGNKAATGSALSISSLGAGRQALRQMTDIDGKTPIGVTPKHLVVGPALETTAEQILHELSAVEVSSVNPFAGKLTLHVEPRFAGNAWRLFADPSEISTIVIAYLNGIQGPVLQTKEGWTTLGIEFRTYLDFGCGIEDFRGTYLNPGA